ncbi:MAG: endonuclease/exonuclease/phosphatase family protein [Clostridia bacterium]|nr:endonuclease/exonuclease/phosphatase family protein [Clostridia bacterium]
MRRSVSLPCALLCVALAVAVTVQAAIKRSGDRAAFPASTAVIDGLRAARSVTPPVGSAGTLRLMNANLLSDGRGFDGSDARERFGALRAVLDCYAPDVVTVQEMSLRWYACLLKNRTDYQLVRPFDTGLHLRMNGILYDPDRLLLLQSGAAPFSAGDGERLRCMVWAQFEAKATGARFWVLTTHFSRVRALTEAHDAAAVATQTNELLAKIDELTADGLPLIVAGDFNARENPRSRAYFAYGRLASRLWDARDRAGSLFSGAERPVFGSTGDHVFVSGAVRVERFGLLSHAFLNEMSDHYPVFADLTVDNARNG